MTQTYFPPIPRRNLFPFGHHSPSPRRPTFLDNLILIPQGSKMELQLSNQKQKDLYLSRIAERTWSSFRTLLSIKSVETDQTVPTEDQVFSDDSDFGEDIEDSYDPEPPPTRKRTKKRKIYCFNCNRQEFHIMAFKGTAIHSFLVGMTFGLARIFGPYRCTCCGKKRAMYADYCSLSYHWRIASERRLSKTSRRRSSGRRKR